jgi:ferric-dicitrate binding protein FerR (iron transport regulator)
VVKLRSAGFSGGPQETAWARKKIQVSNMRLSEIAAELENWYGVEITVDPAVADNRYTGTFEDETVTSVLDMLQASYPFSYQLNGNEISIKAAVAGK